MLTVIKPPLIKDFSPVNSANTLPSPHHRPLLLQQSKIISAELHKREHSGNRMFLGLWMQNSIPWNGKENDTLGKTSMHIKFSMMLDMLGSWVWERIGSKIRVDP